MSDRARGALLLAVACAPLILLAEDAAPKPATLDVVVERRDSGEWKAVDPHYVFASGDQIRFVFRSEVPGHLYVLNRPPSGASEWIFPADHTDPDNLVAPGRSYRIPASGSFVISGPPGFDTTVWILSPEVLHVSAADLLPGQNRSFSTEQNLIPRCGDTPLTARGPCTDDRAGASPFHERINLPKSQSLLARDLNFSNDGERTRITPADESTGGVIVYEFRIAHR
ncbi:MAG TPA: DUF4384 domain-containing protein [Bryobacteraceae bacterium]|nr:DUF4384 domain-containing protein [Bryobacteraceae bacterium]